MPPTTHPFTKAPHRTLFNLSATVLISLIAEPLTGIVDTAFVAQLGAVPLAALGLGTVALSSSFWVFNFLGVGTQTEVAQALGRGDTKRAAEITGLALILAVGISVLAAFIVYFAAGGIARGLGAEGAVVTDAVAYMRVRLFGTPAVLITAVVFGGLRGKQDMTTPLWIAVGINGLNIFLDWVLISGVGSIPAMGITGAALASTISQWLGAVASILAIRRAFGLSRRFDAAEARKLFVVGGDLFVRTGLLVGWLLLATRVANQAGAEAGAAHTAIRQVFLFSALFLDAFAITAQSLVGFFFGAERVDLARKVVSVGMIQSTVTGAVALIALLLGQSFVERLLVPDEALAVFGTAWLFAALTQPFGAIAYFTDGVHWGTADFRFLRNAMIIATGISAVLLFSIDTTSPTALRDVWVVSLITNFMRAGLGFGRISPGFGDSPWKTQEKSPHVI